MLDVIETSENGRYRVRLEIDQETSSCNPREEDAHITHVITPTQQRYIDVDPDGGPLQYGWDHFSTRPDSEKLFIRWAHIFHRAVVVEDRPHDGAWSFWYMTLAQIAEIGNTPEEAIAIEIKEYRAWAEGEVFGYVVEKAVDWDRRDGDDSMTTWETVDDCWGLIGREYAEESARDAFELYRGGRS